VLRIAWTEVWSIPWQELNVSSVTKRAQRLLLKRRVTNAENARVAI
jgi:hypothetical protein